MYYKLDILEQDRKKEMFLDAYNHLISPWKYNVMETFRRGKYLKLYIEDEYTRNYSYFLGG